MEENQFLTFLSGSESFALDIHTVKEIKEYTTVTPIPLMPSSVMGVINLRGNVVPIIDLQLRLGKEKSKISKRSCIIIVEVSYGSENTDIGILVDSVSEVIDIPLTDIEKNTNIWSHNKK